MSQKRISRKRALAIGGSVAGGLITAAVPAVAASGGRLVLNGVTIVDTHDGKLTRNMAIVIDDGKIAKISAAGSFPASHLGRNFWHQVATAGSCWRQPSR